MNIVFFIIATLLMVASDPTYAWILCKNQGKVTDTTLCSSRKPFIHVRPVDLFSNQDILDLADMRYREWVHGYDTDTKTPSLGAFRMATAEIVQERAQEGSMSFLARLQSSHENDSRASAVVGSAELSPIELKGITPVSHLMANRSWLYVTDVVTSSNHRRLGVGTALMDAVESAAMLQFNATRIYLHVRPENAGAMEFYFKRGYRKSITDMRPEEVNISKLAEAAGATGQTLLRKELVAGDNYDDQIQSRNDITNRRTRGSYKGFGKQTID